MSRDPPTVFISYSHDSHEHMDRVLALANRLRREGVDTELDQYAAHPAEGWPAWTEKLARAADFVIVVATETYRRRFDGEGPPGEGLGVRWEGSVIRQALYDDAGLNHKLLPVVFSAADEVHIPGVLRSATRYDVGTAGGYESLYRRLTDQPAVTKPELGVRKSLPPRDRRQDFITQAAPNHDASLPRRDEADRHGEEPGPARRSRASTPRQLVGPGVLATAVGALCYGPGEVGAAGSTLFGLGAGLGAAFLGQVWQRLEWRWADSLADWIDAQVRLYGSLLLSGFRRRYYRQLRYRHRVFNIRGLQTQGVFTLELEKVFVDLKVAPQSVEAVSPTVLRAEGLSRNSSVWELLVSGHAAFRSLAVVGPPGCGKTTLLQHLALIFAQNQQRRHERRCPAFVPILLFLRDHAATVTASDPPSLAELATDAEARADLRPPAQWFERKLRSGKALVLLDGLDEVADAETRRRVVEWVGRQIERYGESRFLVTSRPHGYQTNPLPAATVLEVQPFTLKQVERFVAGWYLANEVLSFGGRNDPGVRQKAREQGRDLLQRLRNAPTLAALAVNPLLLTMIAMVHRYRGALPGRRVELYAEICDVLLGHWQAAKGLAAELTPAQQRVVLQPLAFHLMEAEQREIEGEEAAAVIRDLLVEIRGRSAADPRAFLRDVQAGSGLLLEREAGVYSFAHLTFQEYLAAAHLLELRDPTLVVTYVHAPWWHETIRLYVAQSDATPIIRACLDLPEPSVQALTLAYECLGEGRQVAAEAREELEQQLIGDLESPEPQRAKLAAEVMLELRLRNLLRLSDAVEIDTAYVSCAEYQLFLDELHMSGWQPDHWRAHRFPQGAAQQPIAGVRFSDAEYFCQWLTSQVAARSERWRYRLATAEEAQTYPVHPLKDADRFETLRVDAVGSWVAANPPRVEGVAERFRDQYTKALNEIIDRDPDLARNRDRDRDLHDVLDYDTFLDLIHSPAFALDPAFDCARRRDLNRELDPALDRVRALDRDHDRDRGLDSVFRIYLTIAALKERIRGNLPAWESIRIVRERLPVSLDRRS